MDENLETILRAKEIASKEFNRFHMRVVVMHGEGARLQAEDFFIVWFSKTLQNWKAIVSTKKTAKAVLFEITHNGDKNETYVDTYIKYKNECYKDENTLF